MSIDNIKVDIEKRTIVPKTKDRRPVNEDEERIQLGLRSCIRWLLWLWRCIALFIYLLELMHDHHYHISDTTFVGEEADILGDIGDAGMDMGESSLLDTDLDMDTRLEDLGGVDGFDSVADVAESGGDWFDFGDVDFGGGIDI